MRTTCWRWTPCWRCAACAPVDTLLEVCRLRSESIRGQLEGDYPITLAQQGSQPGAGVDASHVDLRALGDFDDLEAAKERQDEAAAVAE